MSTGVLLLGTDEDPAAPGRRIPPEAPRYDAHLTTLKSLQRICDGLHTVFLVDRAATWPGPSTSSDGLSRFKAAPRPVFRRPAVLS